MSPRIYGLAALFVGLLSIAIEWAAAGGALLVSLAVLAFWVHEGPPLPLRPSGPGTEARSAEERWGRNSAAVLLLVVVLLVAGAITPAFDYEPAMFLVVLATIRLADSDALTPWLRYGGAVVAISLPLAINLIGQLLSGGDDWTWYVWSMAMGVSWGIGDRLRAQRVIATSMAESRQATADRAVADERRRIARDLHDDVGHMLAAMMLHVGGARHVMGRDPAEADRALGQAEEVGRESLRRIRQTVGSLRDDDESALAPTIGGAEVPALVDTYRAAGLAVEDDLNGAAEISGATGAAVYRIVQEALSNVVQHAPGARAVVSLRHEDELTVVVENLGTGAATPGEAGNGVRGMTERVAAVGGTLEAGPSADGWRVEARFPDRGHAPHAEEEA